MSTSETCADKRGHLDLDYGSEGSGEQGARDDGSVKADRLTDGVIRFVGRRQVSRESDQIFEGF
jgi:hypothetical protein